MSFKQQELLTERKAATSFPIRWHRIGSIIGLVIVASLFVFPLFRLILLSFQDGGAWGLSHYTDVLQEKRTWKTVLNTVYIVSGSTIISLLFGISMAWVIACTNVRGKKWMQVLLFVPFIIPSYMMTLAWVQLFAQNGLLHQMLKLAGLTVSLPQLYSHGGIIFLLGLSHYPLVYLLTVDLLRKLPRELGLAAKIGGASKWVIYRKIIFPLLLPGITSGGLLAFLSNLDNFGIPAFLGIPANIQVLSTYIYEEIVGFGPAAFSRAAVLSVLLGCIALIGVIFQWRLTRRAQVLNTNVADRKPRIFLSKPIRIFTEIIIWLFFIFTSFVPFISMALVSLTKAYGLQFSLENMTWEHYIFLLFEDPKAMHAIWISLKLAFFTTVFALVIGTAVAYIRFAYPTVSSKLLEMFITIPYALPGTVFALCMIFTWMEPIPGWNPGIYGTIWILFIAYVTRFLILQVRGSLTAFSQVDSSMEAAGQISGAGLVARWKTILIPILLPGIVGGALLVMLTSLTELTISNLLWSSGTETIGVVIFGYEQAGYTTYSTAFSMLIIMGIFVIAMLFFWANKGWNRKVLKK